MSITSLWPTEIHTTVLTGADLTRVTTEPARLPEVLPDAHPGRDLAWTWRTERWEGGFHAGLRHSPGTWCALLVIAARAADQEDPSGALILHDPRFGAANVGLPGLPWGRPLTLPTRPGLLAITPGWLPWQIAPVRADDERTVLTAHTT